MAQIKNISNTIIIIIETIGLVYFELTSYNNETLFGKTFLIGINVILVVSLIYHTDNNKRFDLYLKYGIFLFLGWGLYLLIMQRCCFFYLLFGCLLSVYYFINKYILTKSY